MGSQQQKEQKVFSHLKIMHLDNVIRIRDDVFVMKRFHNRLQQINLFVFGHMGFENTKHSPIIPTRRVIGIAVSDGLLRNFL